MSKRWSCLVDYQKKKKKALEPTVLCLVSQSCPTLTPWAVAHQALLSMGFPRQEYWSGLPSPTPGDVPNPELKPRSPAWQADSLPSEPLGKAMNTEVGSLSHLQGIFPTQELNQGLLNCRQILYQLSFLRRLETAPCIEVEALPIWDNWSLSVWVFSLIQ